ncbi:hypothetical protein GCM10011414_16230 [Croceivirga lutea]|uniref:type IV pili methyl-accepting chemotaxis transducer N-terminal domain-containing protein n=1 Tax=Croceivirga lutea TaxID=1775167 RepID=UPI00163A88B2|nr:type IV pili methyl-accepting chemotaxis transducer N-terminal domain-containing protein [Croceivirga lutea]GGG47296.1 hypothetical protein GCM10011414_16230 [Croceivirga lutea]
MNIKKPKFFEKGFRAYYLLVVSIILLTIAIQSIIQYSLNQQRSTALVVNLAGKQRALSQRLLNEVYSCRFHNCDYAEVKLTLSQLVQMNTFLQEGNENYQIEPLDEEEIKANFRRLKPYVVWFQDYLGDFNEVSEVDFDELRLQVDGFFNIMDEIVIQFQRKSEADIKGMMLIEVELAIFSVLIVLFEIFFIVNPIIKRIQTQKKKLKEIAWHQNQVLDSHLKNLKDLNYVLKIEKNPERQLEIVKFIGEELDSLSDAKSRMKGSLEKSEDYPMPHDVLIGKLERSLEKLHIKTPKTNRDGKAHSVKSKTPDTTAPQ